MQNIICITTIILLIKMAYVDYIQKIIPDKFNIILALLGSLNVILNFENCKIYIASAAITFAVFLFLAVITDGGIGGGDIKLFTAMGLIFSPKISVLNVATFTVAAIISITRVIFKRINMKESIALASYISASTLICLINFFIYPKKEKHICFT